MVTRRTIWCSAVPLIALPLAAGRARAQACGGEIGVTAMVVDLEEAGGVGAGVRTLTERALEPLIHPGRARAAVRRDTTVRIRRATVTVRTLPPPGDSAGDRVSVTVVYPD
jgi:hypothetical protein